MGRLAPELTDRYGLAAAPGVVIGGHDQACGALGVGLTRPGLAMATGIPVITPRITEAAAFGAALLAGIGVGRFSSAAAGAEQFLELTDTYQPDPARHKIYTRQYEPYREVHPAVAPISHRL